MNATLVKEASVAHVHHDRLVKHVDQMPRTGDLIEGGTRRSSGLQSMKPADF